MRNPVSVLLIEDSEFDAKLIVYAIRKCEIETVFERVCCENATREALLSKSWDIILSDHMMPSFNSIEALKIRNEVSPNTPFFIISSCLDTDIFALAISQGCTACISKSKLDLLGKLIRDFTKS